MTPSADMGLVRRVIEESRVDTTVEAPGWSGWVQAVAAALFDWLRGVLPGLPDLSGLATGLGPAATVALALLLACMLYALVRTVLRARTRRVAVLPPAAVTGAAHPPPERDPGGWKAEMDTRLAAGDLAGALEALWWWFARSATRSPVDPAWTSGELLERSGRPDLAVLAGLLDRMLYGARRPAPEDLRTFLGRAESTLS